MSDQELRAALEPFLIAANDADGYPDNHPLGCDPAMQLKGLTVGDLRRARAALSRSGEDAPQGWQPISTAPKDGTAILAYGHWAGEINGPDKEPGLYIIAWHGGGTDFLGFEWGCQNTDAYAAWVKPTHWMPLPIPPDAEGDGK